MVKTASSPSSSSPVTITVSSGGKTGGSRSMGLTSPVPRASVSNNPNSPLSSRSNRASGGGRRVSGGGGGNYSSSMSKENDMEEETNTEYVTYTVHIPPTPDRKPLSASETSLPEEDGSKNNNNSYISGTIFTGGFNSVTRGHVIECSTEKPPLKPGGLVCGMKGCDEEAIKGPCECGFKICRDCYTECYGNNNGGGGGKCPGCKEPYNNVTDGEEEEVSEGEDQALPLPSMADFKLDKRLSLVKSFKAQNHPPDFDHTRWLFETKGTYGYGNAVWPKDGYGANGFEPPPDFGEKARRPLTRKVGVSAAILSPYRSVIPKSNLFYILKKEINLFV